MTLEWEACLEFKFRFKICPTISELKKRGKSEVKSVLG